MGEYITKRVIWGWAEVVLMGATTVCSSPWVNYNDLTATSLEIIVSKGNHPQMALIQVTEII